jgi:hypothetical protein
MKLTDFNPRWISSGGEGIFDKDNNPIPEREGIGIMFNCPCGNNDYCSDIFIPFENPLYNNKPIEYKKLWKRKGDTFETLTLTPSILRIKTWTDKDGKIHDYHNCGWHGFITNGEIITV